MTRGIVVPRFIYAKLGETQQAISLLIKINEKKGFYANDAAVKLTEMKK